MICITTKFMRAIAAIVLFATALQLPAQKLAVAGFKPAGDVLHGKQIRTDVNGAEAAVVKVLLPVPGATFDGNLIGEAEYYGSEYWVWLEGDGAGSGTSMFDIRCPGAPTLRIDFTDFGITRLKSKNVYELTLDIPRELLYGRSAAPADLGGDYFVLTVTPKENIMVKIDGTLKTTRGGQLNEFLTYGDHSFSVESPGYIAQTGAVTLTRGGGKVERDITLRSAMGTLTITAETPGTVISVNGQRKGSGSWSAPMIAGNYQIEAALEGHRPYSTALVMSEGESKSITIPALDPIYAAVHIDYYPSKSQVKIDGKSVGVTPLALNNLTAATHTLEISADGYQTLTRQITLSESEPLRLSGELTAAVTTGATSKPVSQPRNPLLSEANYYCVKKKYKQAAQIYRQLAEQGDAEAQCELGNCYYFGQGVNKSYEEAAKWYRKSAEQGYAKAQYKLGHCYDSGNGVDKSYEEATRWFRLAAEQGYKDAYFFLALQYQHGSGVTKSYKDAVEWYRKDNNSVALCNMGECYWEGGYGLKQDKNEAVRCWREAANCGYKDAKKYLKKYGYSE